MVEIEGWEPITVTAMSDTTYQGRAIPIAWQIEIVADSKGLDGYGLETLALEAAREFDPSLPARCHRDTEAAACVLWVEAEADCKALLLASWPRLTGGA